MTKRKLILSILLAMISSVFIYIYNLHYSPSGYKNDTIKSSTNVAQEVKQFNLDVGYDAGPYHIDYHNLKSIPWNIKEPQYSGYASNVQKMYFATPLLSAYLNANDTIALAVAKDCCLEWIKVHGDNAKDISKYAWADMNEGKRAEFFSKVFLACEKEKLLTPEEKEIFLASIKKHITYLMNNKNINFVNNHGLHQIVSQVIISKNMMSYDSIYKDSYKQAQKRLRKIIKKQFYLKDGIHKENSPTYQYNCVLALKSLMDEGYLNTEQTRLVNKINKNIYWLLLPNSHIANLGDSDYSLTLSDYKNQTKDVYKVFKEAGYFVVKTDKSYLIQHSGFGSKAHRHNDDFGFYWYDLGQNILMDTGKYAYVSKPNDSNNEAQNLAWQNRLYALSSRAHNTLEFNDEINLISKNECYKNAIKKVIFNKKENYYIVKSKTNVRGVDFERTIYYSPEKYLVVYDNFNSAQGNLTTTKQWFHLAPDLTMQKDGEGYVVNLKDGHKLKVSQLNKNAIADKLYYGEKEPRLQGWISMEYNEIEPNYAFNYEIKNSNKGEFITLFVIDENVIPKSILSKLNK